MRAMSLPLSRARRLVTATVATSVVALTMLGGVANAADSRAFTVSVSAPSKVSQGGSTAFQVVVASQDNQTIANVKLTIPGTPNADPDRPNPAPWPSALTISSVFGTDAGNCTIATDRHSVTCVLGNIAAFGQKTVTVLAAVPATVPVSNPAPPTAPPPAIKFSASAETNNENGSNRQVETSADSAALEVVASNANQVFTANQSGQASTDPLATGNNLQTTLNLLQDNGGKGNVIVIAEGSNGKTQPTYCVTLKVTCQPDFTDVTVNTGNTVTPYLETILTAKVPNSYSLKKAFIIHVLADGTTIDTGFPLFNSTTTACAGHPERIPCADFSLANGIVQITVHTDKNGKFQY
jgi:hypothetical protein